MDLWDDGARSRFWFPFCNLGVWFTGNTDGMHEWDDWSWEMAWREVPVHVSCEDGRWETGGYTSYILEKADILF